MALVDIPLTQEQRQKIKEATGLDIQRLTVEKVDDARLDLKVEELEDRVNPLIEEPSGTPIARPRRATSLAPGTVYMGVTSQGLYFNANP